MPKQAENTLKLDDKDLTILKELQEDGRQTYRDLAKKIKVPESTVRKRVAQLEKRGVIQEYDAVLNSKKAGFTSTAIVMIKINQFKLKDGQLPLRYIADQLAKFEEIQEVHSLAGEFDIMCKVRGRDQDALNEWIFTKLPNVSGIDRVTTFNIFYTAKETQKLNL